MFAHHVVYRFENGAIEEFVGTGLTARNARQNSVDLVRAAVAVRAGETFSMSRITYPERTGGACRANAGISTRTYVAALS